MIIIIYKFYFFKQVLAEAFYRLSFWCESTMYKQHVFHTATVHKCVLFDALCQIITFQFSIDLPTTLNADFAQPVIHCGLPGTDGRSGIRGGTEGTIEIGRLCKKDVPVTCIGVVAHC